MILAALLKDTCGTQAILNLYQEKNPTRAKMTVFLPLLGKNHSQADLVKTDETTVFAISRGLWWRHELMISMHLCVIIVKYSGEMN